MTPTESSVEAQAKTRIRCLPSPGYRFVDREVARILRPVEGLAEPNHRCEHDGHAVQSCRRTERRHGGAARTRPVGSQRIDVDLGGSVQQRHELATSTGTTKAPPARTSTASDGAPGRDGRAPNSIVYSVVSLLSDAGVPVGVISRPVGHSGTSVTEAVYLHQIRPVLRHGAEVMTGLSRRKTSDSDSQCG